METTVSQISPRQTFEDNMRPAQLLLHVYRLLDSNDTILSAGNQVDALRSLVKANAGEELMLIYNEIFLGLVRERAHVHRSDLRQAALCNLLRQAVVCSCTALETYLPALLRTNLPVVIRVRGRNFVPQDDSAVLDYLKPLQFSLDEMLRLLSDENAPEYIANRILGMIDYSYLSSRKGVHVVGSLLGLAKPWDEIAEHLKRDKKELMTVLEDTVTRRNNIVHRADRPQSNPGGDQQAIAYSWTQQAVDAIGHICLAVDELVTERIAQIQALVT